MQERVTEDSSKGVIAAQSLSRARLFVSPGTAAFVFSLSHDSWKNHSFDYMDLCWQGNGSAF